MNKRMKKMMIWIWKMTKKRATVRKRRKAIKTKRRVANNLLNKELRRNKRLERRNKP